MTLPVERSGYHHDDIMPQAISWGMAGWLFDLGLYVSPVFPVDNEADGTGMDMVPLPQGNMSLAL